MLTWTGTPGALYQVEGAVTPEGPWHAIGAPTANFTLTTVANEPSQFFRVGISSSPAVPTGPAAPGGAVQWADAILGSGYGKNVRITGVTSDSAGNAIVCGTFVGSVDFGGQVVNNTSGSVQCFVAKYDSGKRLLWVNGVTGGTGLSTPYGVVVNNNGDVFAAGFFTVSEQIEGRILTTAGYEDMFLFKFSGQNGTVAWTKTFGGARGDYVRALTLDNAGNPIIVGNFSDVLSLGATLLTSSGGMDLLLAKFSAADGNVIWARKYGGAGDEVPYSVATGPDGNLYVTGQITGSCNLGGANVTSVGAGDIFIAKYDSNGAHQWSQRYGTGGYSYGYGVCVDSENNVILTGTSQSPINFGNGATLTPMAGSAIFVAKYTSEGANLWAKMFGGTSGGSDTGRALATDANNNIVLTGTLVSTASFDSVLLLGATPDILVTQLSATGAVQWAHRYGDTGMLDEGLGLSVSKNTGAIYVGGYFNGTVDFGTGPVSGPYNCENGCLIKLIN